MDDGGASVGGVGAGVLGALDALETVGAFGTLGAPKIAVKLGSRAGSFAGGADDGGAMGVDVVGDGAAFVAAGVAIAGGVNGAAVDGAANGAAVAGGAAGSVRVGGAARGGITGTSMICVASGSNAARSDGRVSALAGGGA
jgi:hypothetical protein